VSAAHEAPADDPQAVADAIVRAAGGEVVHLVRDGQPVADVVPAGSYRRISEEAWSAAKQQATRMAARFGAPTLKHYRRVYEALRQPWPGDEEIRARYPVADAS
jgi:antitoxin (DNA-binding transcriptional repressor) of toxin-antitoxin stability system